ncbi:7060_t:CDS:10 [Funneliformis caledonium]|uniref:7060_t:CDS:1 n=1 Tax=Funneliformis caledonium TaxID=1117310 RepID=A0A9N9H143_9GLOM|nr:7060_t:CDS:10 [Funneliformis caledonium]
MDANIISIYDLPRPLSNIITKHVGINQDWMVVKIIPFKIHVFCKETLKEIWKFPFDPIDICQDFLYDPTNSSTSEKSNANMSFLVLTKDGSIWKIQSNVQRNKRNFDSHQRNEKTSPMQSRQIKKNNEFDSNYSQKITRSPNNGYYNVFIPPPIFTVGNECLIFSKEGLCSLFPCNLFNDNGILLGKKDGEIGFLSLKDRIVSEYNLFVPFDNNEEEYKKNATFVTSSPNITLISKELAEAAIGPIYYDTDLLITGYSSGILSFHYFCKGNVESDIFTSLNESIQAIYTLHLKQGEETKLGSSLLRPKPKLSTVHNTLLIVGVKGTISLLSTVISENSSLTLAYKEYYVPNPVHSSFVYKNRLVVTAGEGRIIVINFDRNMFSEGKFVPLHTIPVIFPKGTIRMCHFIASEENSFDGIFYALTVDGRLIRSQFSVTSDQTPKQMMSVEQLKEEIHKQTIIIKELTSKQVVLDKLNAELNPAIIARNEVIHELQRVHQKRETEQQLDEDNSPLVVECFPIIMPHSMNGSVTQRIFLRIRLTSRIGIQWSKWWSLFVTMTHHSRSIGTSNHEKAKHESLCYSVSLLDMTVAWERDIEINLRFLQFPIMIKLALCFTPPTPIDHTNDVQYQPQATYFPLVNLQFDILDFINPCPQHILLRLQQERHFTIYPSLPDFITPFDGNFFATKGDLRKFIEKLMNKPNEELRPYSDFISSLNINSTFIKFFLRSGDVSEVIDLEEGNNGYDGAWKRCLSVLLGENVETEKLREIIKSVDYAVFTTSMSLEPVILNLKKLDPIECSNGVPFNSTPVEIRIACRTPEVLLLVEAALLSRLQDFCLDHPLTRSESPKSSSMKSNVTINNNNSVRQITSVDLTSQLNLIKEDYENLINMLEDQPNENSTVNQKEETIEENLGDWNQLEMVAKRLENRVVDIFKIIRKELEKHWISGVVEI